MSEENNKAIPICMYCKKIESDGEWVEVESYFMKRFGLRFTHGVCPKHKEELRDQLKKDGKIKS